MTISSWLNFGRPAHPGRGSAAGRNFLAPPYYSQRAVLASLQALFSLFLLPWLVLWRRLSGILIVEIRCILTFKAAKSHFEVLLPPLYLLCGGCSIVIMFDQTAMLDVAWSFFHWACSVDDLLVLYMYFCTYRRFCAQRLCPVWNIFKQLERSRRALQDGGNRFFDWSIIIRLRVISCAQKCLNCEVLNLKCTKELQHFASTKILTVRKLDRLNANTSLKILSLRA